jgi:hypothetical protein
MSGMTKRQLLSDFPQQHPTLQESAGVASVIPACRCGKGSLTYSFIAYNCVTTAPAGHNLSTEICAECTTVEANFPTSLHRAARTLHVSIFNETHTGNRNASWPAVRSDRMQSLVPQVMTRIDEFAAMTLSGNT